MQWKQTHQINVTTHEACDLNVSWRDETWRQIETSDLCGVMRGLIHETHRDVTFPSRFWLLLSEWAWTGTLLFTSCCCTLFFCSGISNCRSMHSFSFDNFLEIWLKFTIHLDGNLANNIKHTVENHAYHFCLINYLKPKKIVKISEFARQLMLNHYLGLCRLPIRSYINDWMMSKIVFSYADIKVILSNLLSKLRYYISVCLFLILLLQNIFAN